MAAALIRERQVLSQISRRFGLGEDSLRERLKALRKAVSAKPRSDAPHAGGVDAPAYARSDTVPAWEREVVELLIHDADSRRQNFGMVQNAFMRIVNAVTGREISRYDLTEDYSIETALIFGEVYRHGGEWKFRAVGQGYQGGLAPVARDFGVNIG